MRAQVTFLENQTQYPAIHNGGNSMAVGEVHELHEHAPSIADGVALQEGVDRFTDTSNPSLVIHVRCRPPSRTGLQVVDLLHKQSLQFSAPPKCGNPHSLHRTSSSAFAANKTKRHSLRLSRATSFPPTTPVANWAKSCRSRSQLGQSPRLSSLTHEHT